jgi:hypothetical protein
MSNLWAAVQQRDLESVKRLVAEGADVKETKSRGFTPLLFAVIHGHIPIIQCLLNEGGSNLDERTLLDGASVLVLAARYGCFHAIQYLLEEQGASMSEIDDRGRTVWSELSFHRRNGSAELSSLLKVMVMLEDAPASFIAKLSPQHAELWTRGLQLRPQLPFYLEQQRAAVVVHCPLPAVLQSVVAAYTATTPEDMWADGLHVQAPRAKRGRTKTDKEDGEDGEDAPPVRRSLRLPQKHV